MSTICRLIKQRFKKDTDTKTDIWFIILQMTAYMEVQY